MEMPPRVSYIMFFEDSLPVFTPVQTGEIGGVKCDQESTPYDIFPAELWELIFDQVTSSQDFIRIAATFPELDIILHPRKTLWLFELVFPLLLKHSDIQRQDLLLFRNICKKWRDTVDNYLSQYPPKYRSYRKNDYKNVTNPTSTCRSVELFHGATLKNLTSITNYLEAEFTHAPFPGRTVYLKPSRNVNLQEYYNLALELFKQVGSHVWHLEANYTPDTTSALQFYLAIQKLLQHLPNLRSLALTGQDSWSLRMDTANMIEGFVQSVAQNPLPQLQHLMSLTLLLDLDGGIPNYFYDPFIMSYGNQLEKLVLNKWKDKYGPHLHNLVDLDMFRERSYVLLEGIIGRLKAPEKLLRFVTNLHVNGVTNAMPDYIKILEPCVNLEDLQIPIFCSEWFEKVDKEGAVLKNLKYLSLIHNEAFSYEFLRQLPSLEHLFLRKCENEEVNKDSFPGGIGCEIRKHFKYTVAESVESKLWELLPSLKLFTLTLYEDSKKTVKQFVRS